MKVDVDLSDVVPKASSLVPAEAQIASGIPIPPIKVLRVMSPGDWEDFTEEWLSYHKNEDTYHSIKRYSGPRDLGLDVVAFTSESGFDRPWDSYQCKHYDHALHPGDVYGEVGKVIYHSFQRTPPFNQACRVPRRHVFVSPLGVGISLGRLLRDPARFKDDVRDKWQSHCTPEIGEGIDAPLEGALREYYEAFDFAIFEDRAPVQLIEEHAKTVFYHARFGGGFPQREDPDAPPDTPAEVESLYLRKLIDAYSDHLGQAVTDESRLQEELLQHYNRQRVLFYSAESLRNFARDRTPPCTFDSLQDDVYDGVVDTCESAYPDALVRLRATVSAAGQLDVSGNALVSVTRVPDKQGICHQLANDDRLTWKKK